MGRGVLTHTGVAVLAFAVGAVAGYAGAGDSAGGPGEATVTVTATSTATRASAANDPGNTRRPRSGEIPGDGTYVVSEEIKPGTYRTDGPQGGLITSCYWARLSSTSGEFKDIIANGSTEGQTTVTIASTDKAFTTTGCKTWQKVG